MIIPDIVAAIGPLFGGRVFPMTASADAQRPFCIYQQIGGMPVATLCGNTTERNARIQFTVWCEPTAVGGGVSEVHTLLAQMESILTSSPFFGVSQGSMDDVWDEMTRTYGGRQDYSFWF